MRARRKGLLAPLLSAACATAGVAGLPHHAPAIADEPAPVPGSRFREALRDGGGGPEMVVIPAGRFRMGCISNDQHCWEREHPVREVTFAAAFALSVHEVTFDDYDRFAPAEQTPDAGWGRGRRPVINVSRDDAHAYVAWLSAQTGAAYRLPSESEWEYAARAGTVGKYHWGDEIGHGHANCHGCGSAWGERKTAPVGSFAANGFGLHDMLGNVWEWVEDDGEFSLSNVPPNGSPWVRQRRAPVGVVRGGAWGHRPRMARSAVRLIELTGARSHFIGFRVARTLASPAPADLPAPPPAPVEPSDMQNPDPPLPPVSAGSTFRESLRSGGNGPEMVVIPAGSFRKGCLAIDGCVYREWPVHRVVIAQPFALSVHEATFEDYDRSTFPDMAPDNGWGRDRRPAINVSWDDANAYAAWLAAETGGDYRLPTESEWEYAARAGTTTKYHWGDEVGVNRANCAGCGSPWDDRQTAPTGSFAPNAFGLYDMHGNVFEWIEDSCWWPYDARNPRDGAACLIRPPTVRGLRGGSWRDLPTSVRAAWRDYIFPGMRDASIGFRVARTLAR